MNYIAHFQQFIKLYKTPLNPKNGLPSTTLKWPSKYLEGHFCISVIPILFPPETLNRVLGKL